LAWFFICSYFICWFIYIIHFLTRLETFTPFPEIRFFFWDLKSQQQKQQTLPCHSIHLAKATTITPGGQTKESKPKQTAGSGQ